MSIDSFDKCTLPTSTDRLRQQFRNEMPIASQYAYFDHAAVAPLPARTCERIKKFAEEATHQGDIHWPQWAAASEKTRISAAELINCSRSEIALVANTTQGIGLVAEGFPWKPGDNVVVPENEFPSNLVPWRNLNRRGVEIRLVPVAKDGSLDASGFNRLIDEKSRLVALSWIGFSSGYKCEIGSIVDLAHSRNCLVMLDAIQGLGAFPLDVKAVPVDFAVADGHKWMLGPEGAGFLYIREPHLELLQPLNVGWNSLAQGGFDPQSVEIKSSAARYEGGSLNMMGMLGLGASLELLLELGSHSPHAFLHQAILENVSALENMLTAAEFIVETPKSLSCRSGIVGVRCNRMERDGEVVYNQAKRFLLERGVVLSIRGGRLRVSTHAYNNRHDVERLVDGLVGFRRTLN